MAGGSRVTESVLCGYVCCQFVCGGLGGLVIVVVISEEDETIVVSKGGW